MEIIYSQHSYYAELCSHLSLSYYTRDSQDKTLNHKSPLTCHLAKVMSDLFQEGPDNDVTTGSQKSTGILRPSGIL